MVLQIDQISILMITYLYHCVSFHANNYCGRSIFFLGTLLSFIIGQFASTYTQWCFNTFFWSAFCDLKKRCESRRFGQWRINNWKILSLQDLSPKQSLRLVKSTTWVVVFIGLLTSMISIEDTIIQYYSWGLTNGNKYKEGLTPLMK
jgi:hypothetical protein